MTMVMSRRLRFGAIAVLAMAALAGPALAQSIEEQECGALPSSRVLRNPSLDDAPFRLGRSNIVAAIANTTSFNDTQIDAVIADCLRDANRVVSRNQHRVEAYRCAADAALLLAERGASSREDNYKKAFCNFRVVAAFEGDNTRRARAHTGAGQALEGRFELSRNTDHLDRAIAAYTSAIGALGSSATTADQRRAMIAARTPYAAALSARGGREGIADAAYGELLNLLTPDQYRVERAAALVARARVQERLGRTPDQLLPLWREAQGLNASAETNVELARLLLRRAGAGDRPQAMDLLQRAAGLANPASGGVSYQGEAYYYLSLLGLSDPARNWEDVVRNAALAVQAGGGQFRHRALVCLAHIGRGGPDVRDGRDAVACEVDATPAGELLRGMYFIRQAQLVYTPQAAFDTPVRQRWLVALRSAQSAFDRGLALNPGVATLADWPSLPAETARVEDMLRYGKYIVDFCSSAAAPSNPGVDGRAFFERHSALNCRVG